MSGAGAPEAASGQTTFAQFSLGHGTQLGACHAHMPSVPRVQEAGMT
jgi:hypothetical protein